MKLSINKKDFKLNLLFTYIYIVLLFFAYFTNSLISMLVMFLVIYALFFIYSKVKLGKIKYMIASPAFIFGSVFVPYVVFAVFMFILDGYRSRINYFTNDLTTMLSTTKFYLYAYLILMIFFIVFNAVKQYNIKSMISMIDNKIEKLFKMLTPLDFLCMLVSIINLYKLVSYGPAYFSLKTLQKRAVFSSEINHYINIFMTIYSLLITLYFVNKHENKNKILMFFRILFVTIYWGIFLTCERRMFVAYLVGFLIIFISKLDKVKIKYIILSLVTVSILLLSASFRGNITFANHAPKDVIYMSLTEFVCTYSISNYYVDNIDKLDLCYGETYVKNSFMSLFPRKLLPNKPKELGTIFKEKLNLKVGYSFNPMAEGILNFGKYAVIMVPLIILLIVVVANQSYKFNVLMPIIISAFSLDFYRGQFANFFFDCVFCFVFLFLIFKIEYRKK